MSTYNPAVKFHPPLQLHCSATVNHTLLDYNIHLTRARMRSQGDGVIGAGDQISGVLATSPYYCPKGEVVEKLQKHCDAKRILEVLDGIILKSPYLRVMNSNAGRRFTGSQATNKTPLETSSRSNRGFASATLDDAFEEVPVVTVGSLPCNKTTYRTSYTPKDRSKAKSVKDTFSNDAPFGQLVPVEPMTSLYMQDFLVYPPRIKETPLAKRYAGGPPPALAMPEAMNEDAKWGATTPVLLRLRQQAKAQPKKIPMINSIYRDSYNLGVIKEENVEEADPNVLDHQ